ncbi:MAG TPA: hypothetical protein VKV77_00015 [Methylovirgula sp.]|nr:hypothetical protein [Methylovirgula sp.]
MTEQDDLVARDKIDGGFSFALAAFAVGLGLIAVLERVGLPEYALRICVGVLVFSEFLVIAALLRTMRPVDFYACGRSLPAPYVGVVYAGLALGLFLPFLPPLPAGIGFKSVALGFGLGLILAVFLTGPNLRRAAAFSVADFAASRFPNPVARFLIAGIVSLSAGLVALAGYEIALGAFIAATGLERSFSAAIVGIALVFLLVPGGLSGAIWLAAGAVVVSLAALALPALLMLREPTPWALARMNFDALTGLQPNLPLAPSVVLALTLGLAALGPLFAPAIASRDRLSAARGAPLSFVLMALIVGLAGMTMARATLAFDATLVGHTPASLAPGILAASGEGRISICGLRSADPAAILMACAAEPGFTGALRPQDLAANAGYLLESLAALRKEGPTLAGLAGVLGLALGAGIAAAGVQSFATSLGHDILHPNRRRFGPVSRRLAYARALSIALIALCGSLLARGGIDPRTLIALALAVSAALVAPVLALSLVKRASSIDALAAMFVAAMVMAAFIAPHQKGWPPIELASNVVFAALDGFLGGCFVSLLHGRDSLITRPAQIASKDEPPGPD